MTDAMVCVETGPSPAIGRDTRLAWTASEVEQFLAFRLDGLSDDQIGQLLGRSRTAVRLQAYRRELPCRVLPWSPTERARLRAMVGHGASWAECGLALGRSPNAARNKAQRMGIGKP